jgi:beta-glucanase (GH16 family)
MLSDKFIYLLIISSYAFFGIHQTLTRQVNFEKRPQLATHSKELNLVWSDEFNYRGRPDTTKWDYETGGHGWGNNELQYYTSDTANAYVKNGSLHITARKQARENRNYTSARLVTKGKTHWQYGRIEIRAKLPAGRGLWPAVWMLGENRKEAGWPTCGEIDIMEHVGFEKDSIFGTIHTAAFNHMKKTQKGKKVFIEKPYDAFHLYAIDWSPHKIDFLLDNEVYFSIPNEYQTKEEWPFDQPFYLIMNIAVGGNLGGKMGLDESVFPATLEIDYVRIFQQPK